MVIRKMNSVFAKHGRLIFGLITVVIVIAFMGVLNPNGLGSIFSNWGARNAYGEIFGESVSPGEATEKANRDLIIGDLMYNAGLESYQAPHKMQISAFNSLSILAAAKRRGITASNKEITEFITERAKFRNPKTQVFDKKLLISYIDGKLRSSGFSADDLDLAVREYLINSKLLDELKDSVVVTQSETKVFYQLVNEKYYVSYALFDKAQYLKKIKLNKEEAKNYFKGYTPAKEDYIPGKSKVLLVEFKYNTPEIQKLVAKELSAKALKDFYDKNKKLFMNKSKVIPFAKAKGKAKSILASRYAKKFAAEKASKFAEAAYEVGDAEEEKQRKAFEDLLVEFKYKAVQTDWINDDAKKVGAINEPALVKEISIFREVPVSNHVIGKNAAYVAFVTEKIMPRPALFEEIKTKIITR
ncbi:MAG: SurA N-terminal domain-containing protein, partial [Victivallales bacterium]|nr:SurA N-terminal domain-containing protein [Victivallales bacterium]